MRFAVCDDNIHELSHILSMVEEYNRFHNAQIVCESFHNSFDLLEALETRTFDLLLLDILMPGITGMDAARTIRKYDAGLPIIFLTSSAEFAIESYRVNISDYLLKPLNKDIFFESLDKQLEKLLPQEHYLLIKSKNNLMKLPFSSIVSIEVMNHTVLFTTTNGSVWETYGSLAEYETKLLSSANFYKPHRAYIVNFEQVTGLAKDGFTTSIQKTVPIARNNFKEAKSEYMKYLLGGKD